MKKSLALFFLFLLGGICFLIYFQSSLLKEKDNVTFHDEILFGNADTAEGISVNIATQYDRHLFWDTTYDAGTEPKIWTDYNFYSTAKQAVHSTSEGVHMDVDIDSYHFDPKKSRSELKGIDLALFDLYYDNSPALTQETDANYQTKVKQISLKDFYEYYPLYMGIQLEHYDYFWNWNDVMYYETTYESYETSEDYRFLKDFFRIPVIEDDTRLIHLDIDDAGYSTYVSYSDSQEPYYMTTFSAVTTDALYFMFTFDHNGEPADFDTSLIPGGYGIYRIPYETLPKKSGQVNPGQSVDIQATSMVYPLDQAIRIFNFSTTLDKSKLILTYQDSDTPDACTEIAIIDAATLETRQTILLEGIAKPDGSTEVLIPYTLHVHDDFIAASCSSDYLAVMDLKENGLYQLAYVINIHENPVFDYYIDSRGITVMDRKEDRIAIAGLKEKDYDGRFYHESCGFYLAVFDASGLLYYSEHDSSLDQGQYPYGSSTVQPLSYYENKNPIQINWK